jgi:AraC-like DNA-binding protein
MQAGAALGAHVVLAHRSTLGAVAEDLTRGYADAVLVSAALVRATDAEIVVRWLTRLVRGHPAVRFAGLVTECETAAAGDGHALACGALAAAHLLGRVGVHTLLDCRAPGGWAAFRAAVAPVNLSDAFHRACVAAVLSDMAVGADDAALGTGAPGGGIARFFTHAFAPDVRCVRVLAARLGVGPTTLTSRFFRAGLPSPRRYLTGARLVWAARLGEAPALTVAAIASRLDASSPHAFGRSLRLHTGLSPSEFRRRFTGATMLDRYRAVLVAPHRERLRAFDPIRADAPHLLHRIQGAAPDAIRRAA